ncbi:MAG: DNA-processing protein DprA [Opitutales bacterium]
MTPSRPVPPTRAAALLVLNALEGWGPVSGRKALQWAGDDYRRLFDATEAELAALVGVPRAQALRAWPRHIDLAREEDGLAALGARFVPCDDPAYPRRLRMLEDAPLGLYWRGREGVPEEAMAVVGTRHMTAYGRKVTERFTRELVTAGFAIVSGLALGVDACAHVAALRGGGHTLAVLGNGLDVVYPSANRSLFTEMATKGALVSEFPLGRRPDRQTFPQRNRLVSGMTVGTLVVETARRGGSLITARFAMEQNRTVFAVPGRLDQPHSGGCLELIRDGATLVTSVDEMLEELRFMQLDLGLSTAAERAATKTGAPAGFSLAGLGEDEQSVVRVLPPGEAWHLDQLCEATDLPGHRVQAALMMLELQRLVVRTGGGTYERGFDQVLSPEAS